MHEPPILPSYTDIGTTLKKLLPDANISEIHGILCGYSCISFGKQNMSWEELVLGSKKSKNKKAVTFLQEIYQISFQQLNEFSFEFNILLPGDDTAINIRTENLSLWCQGFLTGLKQAATKISFSHDAVEALEDLSKIALVNFEDVTENEEDETAYFELVEYVRLAVLMVYHECKSSQSKKNINIDIMH